jgi:large subunit ribosomal protein L29
MRAEDLRAKSAEELGQELLDLRREQFNLRMQRATGQLARPHEYGRVKKSIARVKTVLAELNAKSEES